MGARKICTKTSAYDANNKYVFKMLGVDIMFILTRINT